MVDNTKCWWRGGTQGLIHHWGMGGDAKPYNHLGKLLVVLHNVKHTLTVWTSNPACTYWSKRKENICPYKNLYVSTYRGFIHNHQKLETALMALKWWLDGGAVVWRNPTQEQRRSKYRFTWQHEWVSKAPQRVKEAASEGHRLYVLCIRRSRKDKTRVTDDWSELPGAVGHGRREILGWGAALHPHRGHSDTRSLHQTSGLHTKMGQFYSVLIFQMK